MVTGSTPGRGFTNEHSWIPFFFVFVAMTSGKILNDIKNVFLSLSFFLFFSMVTLNLPSIYFVETF